MRVLQTDNRSLKGLTKYGLQLAHQKDLPTRFTCILAKKENE